MEAGGERSRGADSPARGRAAISPAEPRAAGFHAIWHGKSPDPALTGYSTGYTEAGGGLTQDQAPRIVATGEREGLGRGRGLGNKAGGAEGPGASGLRGGTFVAGSRGECDGCRCPPSMRQMGRVSKLGQEQRGGRWDHHAQGWGLQPES